jgi:phosphate transport system substrate-binding protein
MKTKGGGEVSSTRNWILVSLLVAGLVLAACGGAATPAVPAQPTAPPVQATQPPAQEPAAPTEAPMEVPEGMQLPAVNPLEVSGDVVTAGSSTVFPLAERMAARFEDEGFAGTITIDSIGSGAGLERFCVTGETDVANSSRAIRESEVESCRAIGREPVEFRVGTDALAITVSQENDFITNATVEELALIFGTATNWSDVNSAWPNEPILRFIPGTDSGTFDYFVEEVFEQDEAIILAAGNTQLSEDDNVLVQGVLGSPYAVGFFGYAYYAENTDVLKILDIEGVTPTAASVDDNSYPLARPLFLYSDAAILQSKPQVAAYINFFLTYVNEEVVDVGYFPSSTVALDQSKQAWMEAMGLGG